MVKSVRQTVIHLGSESSEALEHFSAIPWCKTILEQPGLRFLQCDRHDYERAVGYEPFLSDLLADPSNVGIQHFLSTLAPSEAAKSQAHNLIDHDGEVCADGRSFPQHIDFYDLGDVLNDVSPKLCTGILALFFDRAFATLGAAHTSSQSKYLVAYKNVKPLKPLLREATGISASQDSRFPVIVRSRIDGVLNEDEGQIMMLASVEGPDGIVYGTGEGILVEQIAVSAHGTSAECESREDLSVLST